LQILLLAAGILPAFAGGGASAIAPITLYTRFQQTPPPGVLNAMQAELDIIMEPAGLSFDWHSLAESSGRTSWQLAVVQFKGQCDTADLRRRQSPHLPLGWTYVAEGRVLPFIDINCENLRVVTERQLVQLPIGNRYAIFGRAVARVLAHELYHLLTNIKTHADGGIAKPAYDGPELLARSMRFGKREYAALISHTARLKRQAYAEDGVPHFGQADSE